MTVHFWCPTSPRHARTRCGHPRLNDVTANETLMAGINPAMTLKSRGPRRAIASAARAPEMTIVVTAFECQPDQ
jgi:hypothetical protein